MASSLQIAREAITSGVAATLIASLNAELSARRLVEPALVSELGATVGEIKRMYVAAEARGSGIGRALLDRLETEARLLGLTRVVLETGTRQTRALALYRRAGYTEIPAYGEYTASTATSVCMAKDLPMAQRAADLSRSDAIQAQSKVD